MGIGNFRSEGNVENVRVYYNVEDKFKLIYANDEMVSEFYVIYYFAENN